MTGVVDPDLLEVVRARLSADGGEVSPARVAAALQSEGRMFGQGAVLQVVDALRLDTRGIGPLEELIALPGVTDVLVTGPDAVYIDRGEGLERTKVSFPDDAGVRRLAQRLVAGAGRRLDASVPFADVRLGDGSRLHAALAPVASPGTCLSIRVPSRRPLSLGDLLASATLTPLGEGLLRDVIGHKLSFLVSGGPGSGKTTLLAALLAEVDPRERIVIVEDSRELAPRHPHVVSLEARQANVEGMGEITMQSLVRQALRMRPDRLVVGEVRGAEVADMLTALNTGHDGGCATIHANSARDVPARIEALALVAGLTRAAAHAQLGAAVEVFVHVRRGSDGRRRVSEIGVLGRAADGLVEANPAVLFDESGTASAGPGANALEARLSPRPPSPRLGR
jgi:pilus assembly protein CpaF